MPLDWRIIAAAAAALGVLAGGTLLTAQVQGDLDHGVQTRIKDTGFTPPKDQPALKLNDFKLPKDLPMEIPKGAQISPNLSSLTLPKDLNLSLPNDLDLSNLSFKLPENFSLSLPPGTQFSPPGLTLPNGADIKLPNGTDFKLPPGTKLDLPPEVVSKLLQQGLPSGTLNGARDIKIDGLPPDLKAQIDPPQFDGKGSLDLPAGTTITLPNGQKFPFSAGALAYAARYLLPAGTTFDIPFDANTTGGVYPLPEPISSTQIKTGTTSASSHLSTEITSLPSRVRKGDPVTVSGYVRDPNTGRGIAGAPVDVFLNESKRAPGTLVGSGASDGSGTFTIALRLPSDKPARDYQLVDHAAGFTDASGKVWADGWGDPPFATTASTSLNLTLPARDGFGAGTLIQGDLIDNQGAGVPSVPVLVAVDGTVVARPTTNSAGHFAFSYTFPAGSHDVDARFTGTANYDASNVAHGSITIDDYAIEIPSTLYSKPGDGIYLSGRVLGKGAVAPSRSIVIDGLFGNPAIQLVSDSSGSFSYSFSTTDSQASGMYFLTYTLPEYNVTKTQAIVLNQTGHIALTAPSSWDVEEPIPVSLTLATPTGARLAGQTLRVTLAGPGGSRDYALTTDNIGTASVQAQALRATPGTYTLSARVVNAPYLDAPSVSQVVTLTTLAVDWSGVPQTVVRGSQMSGTATLSANGAPLDSVPISLDAFGPQQLTTDHAGKISWTVTVPAAATLGKTKIVVTAPDHPARTTFTEVVSVPKIALEAPTSFDVGKPVQARLTLTDDQGDPIRNSVVTLIATAPNGTTQRHVVTTDSAGRWSGPLNLSDDEGNVTLAARFDPTGPYLAAEGVQTMSAVAPVPLAGTNLAKWALPLAIGAIALGGGAAYMAIRARSKTKIQTEVAAPVAAPVVIQRPTDIELRFGIPQGEPNVWGVGDALELVAKNHAEAGNFELAWPGGSSTVYLAEDGEARTSLNFREEGEVSLTAKRAGGDFAPVTAAVRIVDYRKETAREFDLFLEKAHAIDSTLTRQSTPREISWTLEARLGSEAAADLEEIALVLEITNYSHYVVTREHYLRFVRAARALDRLFAPAAPSRRG